MLLYARAVGCMPTSGYISVVPIPFAAFATVILNCLPIGLLRCADPAHIPDHMRLSQTGTFEWCGCKYSWEDLHKALVIVLSPDTAHDQLLAQQCVDVYMPASWADCSASGLLLLNTLQAAAALQVCYCVISDVIQSVHSLYCFAMLAPMTVIDC